MAYIKTFPTGTASGNVCACVTLAEEALLMFRTQTIRTHTGDDSYPCSNQVFMI